MPARHSKLCSKKLPSAIRLARRIECALEGPPDAEDALAEDGFDAQIEAALAEASRALGALIVDGRAEREAARDGDGAPRDAG